MTVLAHVGGELGSAWQLAVAAGVLLLTAWIDRRGRDVGVLPARRRVALWAGVVAGVAAVTGPLETAAHTSFTAHMVQHLVLVLVVAPALVVARPDLVVLRVLPAAARRRTAVGGRAVAPRWPVGPILAGLVMAGWLWIAHTPAVYDQQLSSPFVHAVEHAGWVLAGAAVWSSLLRPRRSATRRVLTPLLVLVGLMPATTILAVSLLGGEAPRYAHYAELAGALDDQRLGAAVMWAVMTVVLLVSSLVVIGTTTPRRPRVTVAVPRHDGDAVGSATRPTASNEVSSAG